LATGSAALCITCNLAVGTIWGNSTTVPFGRAANNPNAAPFWLAEGFRKPDAKTTAEPPPKPVRLALKDATIILLLLPGVTSNT
jgi:hypothetical protein